MCHESELGTVDKNDSHIDLNDFIGNAINDLCTKHDWMITRDKEIFSLMIECENLQEARLVYELLDRFFYIHEEERNEGYDGMARFIVEKANNCPQEILLLAMTKERDPDSGQKVLHDLRTFLIHHGMPEHKRDNQMWSLPKKKYSNVRTIFIVDEFVGSGKTIKNRVRHIRRELPEVENIYFSVLAGMQSSINALQSEGIDIYCHYPLKKGITEEYNCDTIVSKVRTMFTLENHLKRNVGTRDIKEFSFGYGHAQSLVAFGMYNIPNSVFPLFWWPEHSSNGKRKRLFIRDEDGLN